MRLTIALTAFTIFLIFVAAASTADNFRPNGGVYHPTYRPVPQGVDAFTRAHPERPFASNPGDQYYDTTVVRNHDHKRDDYWLRNKDHKRRHGWGANEGFRPNPKPGSEVR